MARFTITVDRIREGFHSRLPGSGFAKRRVDGGFIIHGCVSTASQIFQSTRRDNATEYSWHDIPLDVNALDMISSNYL